LCQTAKAWSHDSAVDGFAWLKQFENEEVRRFISRKTRSATFRFRYFSYRNRSPDRRSAVTEIFCSIDEKHGIIKIMFLGEFVEKSFCNAVVVVKYSRTWSILFVSGSMAVYSQ